MDDVLNKTINVSDPSKDNITLNKNQDTHIESENKIAFTPTNNKIKTFSIKSKNKGNPKKSLKSGLKNSLKRRIRGVLKNKNKSKIKLKNSKKSNSRHKQNYRPNIKEKTKSKNKTNKKSEKKNNSIKFNLEDNKIKEYYNSSYKDDTQSTHSDKNDYRETTNLNTPAKFEIEEMPEIDASTLFN